MVFGLGVTSALGVEPVRDRWLVTAGLGDHHRELVVLFANAAEPLRDGLVDVSEGERTGGGHDAAIADDDNSADVMGVFVGGDATLEMNVASSYTGRTTITQNATLDLDAAITGSSVINLAAATALVDATDLDSGDRLGALSHGRR